MQVVILAGGLGTRLSEETEKIPKPMVRIGDLPILLHIMKYYASFGHSDFLIALGYKGFVIEEYFSHHAQKDSVGTSDGVFRFKSGGLQDDSKTWNVQLLDTGLETQTGGRILKLMEYLDPEFLLTYGDGLSNVNLDSLIRHHKSLGRIATVTAVRPPARFGSLSIENDLVKRFSEKNPQDVGWINGGFFCFSKEICDYIPGFEASLEGVPLEKLVSENQLAAYRHEGFWQPMDTLRDKNTLEMLWVEGNAPWTL